jgi:hypothetical protein
MRTLSYAAIVLATSLTAVVAADEFDGRVPLVCTAEQAHDCLPAANGCKRLEPQTDIAPIFKIDYAKKEVRSPYRTATLPILRTSVNQDSLVMQGGDLLVAWSALIDKKTGALTVAIADSQGAYVAFGQCKVAKH